MYFGIFVLYILIFQVFRICNLKLCDLGKYFKNVAIHYIILYEQVAIFNTELINNLQVNVDS